MVLAVLEAHGGLKLGQHDVYLNVAGGLRIAEPAADLAAAAALVSSLVGVALPHDAVYFGEIALSGAVRAVGHTGLQAQGGGQTRLRAGGRAAKRAQGRRGRAACRLQRRIGRKPGCGNRRRGRRRKGDEVNRLRYKAARQRKGARTARRKRPRAHRAF